MLKTMASLVRLFQKNNRPGVILSYAWRIRATHWYQRAGSVGILALGAFPDAYQSDDHPFLCSNLCRDGHS